MNIKPIKNKEDYQEALQKLELIFDAELNTQDRNEARLLEKMIIDYEKKHFAIAEPDCYFSNPEIKKRLMKSIKQAEREELTTLPKEDIDKFLGL